MLALLEPLAEEFTQAKVRDNLTYYALLVISLTFHEFGHAWSARRLGDHTAEELGRLTLNPLKHMDLLFTVILPLYVLFFGLPGVFGGIFFAAAKPVPVDPRRLRSPVRDMMFTSAAGPAMNVLLALFFTGILWIHDLRLGDAPPNYASVVILWAIQMNLGLAVFNMLPIPPLDGHRVLGFFLPATIRNIYYRIGLLGLVLLIVLAQLGTLSEIMLYVFEPLDRWWSTLMPHRASVFFTRDY